MPRDGGSCGVERATPSPKAGRERRPERPAGAVWLLLLAPFTAGCDPVVNFYGSFFPAWVLALAAGITGACLLRWIFSLARIESHLGPLVLVYPALAFLLSCAAWLALFAP